VWFFSTYQGIYQGITGENLPNVDAKLPEQRAARQFPSTQHLAIVLLLAPQELQVTSVLVGVSLSVPHPLIGAFSVKKRKRNLQKRL
jgi:hypothetical protein